MNITWRLNKSLSTNEDTPPPHPEKKMGQNTGKSSWYNLKLECSSSTDQNIIYKCNLGGGGYNACVNVGNDANISNGLEGEAVPKTTVE